MTAGVRPGVVSMAAGALAPGDTLGLFGAALNPGGVLNGAGRTDVVVE